MTGSRTAIFISLLIPAIIIITKLRRLKDLLFVVVLILLVTAAGVYLFQRFKSEIIIQDRITEALRGENFKTSFEGIGKWVNRYELWQDRFKTFKSEGNQLSILLGLGYNETYEAYADNGLISAFINNGITGLLLKLFLFYIFFTSGFLKALRNYHRYEIDISYLAVALSAFVLLLWELTADLTEHYKLGQLFYLLLSIIMLINGKISSTNNHEVPL
jgi:hypothetical protein